MNGKKRYIAALLAAGAIAPTSAHAQTAAAGGAVCLTIDAAHDTLAPHERSATLLMLARQFEINAQTVVDAPCEMLYSLSHIQLGGTISVTLTGPGGYREATALGLDDLPALYNQMVRSIVTGRPMTGFNVVDRTNVTAAQSAPPKRIKVESVGYARLGFGGVFGDRMYGGPSMGFGYRAELDTFAVDVSFLNFQMPSGAYEWSQGGGSGSFLKLQGLRFVNPKANATAYVGGGLSYGFTSFGGGSSGVGFYDTSSHGSGLQGELTVGYEVPRSSALRVFVEANTTLPFYQAASTRTTYSSSRTAPYSSTSVTSHRYAPSVMVSIGLGWQRHRR
jgi:hypothetical protein